MRLYQRDYRNTEPQRVQRPLNFADSARTVAVPRGRILLSTDCDRAEGNVGGEIELSASEGVVLELV